MAQKKNPHDGHRARMYNKILSQADVLADHELLEVLLYFALPRVDTNPIAHDILDSCGTLEKVFSSTAEELTCISGVGKRTAELIIAAGKIFRRMEKEKEKPKPRVYNYAKYKEILKQEFKDDFMHEKFIVFLLDSDYTLKNKLVFSDSDVNSVKGDIPKIVKSLALTGPRFALIAHNHPSGNPMPSERDDFSTKKFFVLCQMHNIALIDHVIVGNGDTYSYREDGRLMYISSHCNLDDLILQSKNDD